jgi:hypothetical protein
MERRCGTVHRYLLYFGWSFLERLGEAHKIIVLAQVDHRWAQLYDPRPFPRGHSQTYLYFLEC